MQEAMHRYNPAGGPFHFLPLCTVPMDGPLQYGAKPQAGSDGPRHLKVPTTSSRIDTHMSTGALSPCSCTSPTLHVGTAHSTAVNHRPSLHCLLQGAVNISCSTIYTLSKHAVHNHTAQVLYVTKLQPFVADGIGGVNCCIGATEPWACATMCLGGLTGTGAGG